MSASINDISLWQLSIAFIPIIPVLVIMSIWRLGQGRALYALSRMLIQLLLIGYFLAYIFKAETGMIIIAVLAVMLVAASWISIGSVSGDRTGLYRNAFIAIAVGGSFTLLIITQGVLTLEPWYLPNYMVPLAGMIFANSMNTVSLAAERLSSEMHNGVLYEKARNIAMQAAMIPITNSLFAVGLVSLPGMMTGQILSGVSPLIAARYQIMVMCMIFASAGISAALFLMLSKVCFQKVEAGES